MKAFFNAKQHVKNLPDVYNKTLPNKEKGIEGSNNYKILEIESSTCNELRECLKEIDNTLDLEKATGKTLDLYGERVGQPRGLATDEQYRPMIKAKISRSISNGSYESVIAAICATFNCEPSEVELRESENKARTVESAILPFGSITKSGFTASQATKLIKNLLPVGIILESYEYEGTFAFADDVNADSETEFDDNAGWAYAEYTEETPEAERKGGYLGYMAGDQEETELPI